MVSAEFLARLKKAEAQERALRAGRPLGVLTFEQRVRWRVMVPTLWLAWADCKWRSITRQRITTAEAYRLEEVLRSWEEHTHEELQAVEHRVLELMGMVGADLDLADIRFETV